MRVSELAKALHLSSKDLLVELKKLRIQAKASTSTLDADSVNRAHKALRRPPAKKPSAAKAVVLKRAPVAKKASAASAKTARPMTKVASVRVAARASRAGTAKSAVTAPAPVTRTPAPAVRPAAAAGRSTLAKPGSSDAERSEAGRADAAGRGTSVVAAPPKVAPATPVPKPSKSAAPPTKKSHRPAAAAGRSTLAKPGSSDAERSEAGRADAAGRGTAAPADAPVAVVERPAGPPTPLELKFPVTVKDLAMKMDVKANDLIKYLMEQKVFASIVQQLDEATAISAAKAFHFEVTPAPTLEEELLKASEPDPAKMVPRAPVVTFMGHVDHGKTSLLDAIRESNVTAREAGGITQHIGAYVVKLKNGYVTFLDTPGHEAFTALRARGANVTDVVVLVVAADDGVMPQTVEAIDHAKAAGVPIVVAINKMDHPDANPQRVKQQLSQYELIGEDWGGKTIMVPVSAKTREGIDTLLELLLLEAELLELKADPTTPAQGTVIEAKQTKNRGPVATLLVQQGTLHVGETLVIGHVVGRVRAIIDDRQHRIKESGPAKPVEILGLPEVPKAGDQFLVVADERIAKEVAERRREQRAFRATTHPKRITLEELHERITEGKLKELRLVLKADVQGSLEALVQSLEKLNTDKVQVSLKILHMAVGDINESDIILAAASDAIVFGFHVGIEPKVQVLAANEGVDIHLYRIIYELVGAIKAAIEGLLDPTIEETFIGRAEVRQIFQVSKSGMVAGCMVTKGVVRRDCTMRVIRGGERLSQTTMANLKRVKDDVREVQEGLECGILLEGAIDLQVGDLLEAWELKEVARKLE